MSSLDEYNNMHDPNAAFVEPTSDFKVGDFVQDISASNQTYRIDRVGNRLSFGTEGREHAWEYDVTVVSGELTGDEYPSVLLFSTRFHKMDSPDGVKLTKQQREIYDAASLLLDRLNRYVGENTIHWMVESLRLELPRLLDHNNADSPVYARRTAYVGNIPTEDTKENRS